MSFFFCRNGFKSEMSQNKQSILNQQHVYFSNNDTIQPIAYFATADHSWFLMFWSICLAMSGNLRLISSTVVDLVMRMSSNSSN